MQLLVSSNNKPPAVVTEAESWDRNRAPPCQDHHSSLAKLETSHRSVDKPVDDVHVCGDHVGAWDDENLYS
ncbi:uncharacterized protein LOC144146695 isoform X4 [Haemaphysalis longicornis]